MQVEVGKIYEGKVTGITKFGAFVEVEGKVTGMVHISEISSSFVNDINEVLKKGQTVKVKVIKVDDNGKIGMSIKRAEEKPKNDRRGAQKGKPSAGNKNAAKKQAVEKKEPEPAYYGDGYVSKPSGDANFEDMLSKFKASSEERISDLKRANDNRRRGGTRRR
ncbi:MAG: S1 RNA-binding domain-containing protein [Ruminococcus sp.]|nr:S1 RNA-binding domain-containing protein [Ruminococcus sp.]MCD7773025.1 S1 RNA-binding domain-containing protein [Ruminococcus sp.]MCD8328385.1 S1 RNA-binding domain-containing protein [Ruminococcus sp.]